MPTLPIPEFNRTLFDSGLVRVGAFRCYPSHPSFRDSGPSRNFCFVFPRTVVQIQHEHEQAFVANPNVVTFYNKGQAYLRNSVSPEGDRCDWFGVDPGIVRDVVRAFDTSVDNRTEMPFRFTRGWSDASTYFLQRRVFEAVTSDRSMEPLAVEEQIVFLLERVVRSAYSKTQPPSRLGARKSDVIRHAEFVLSKRLADPMHLRQVAAEVGISPYHLCRTFYRTTGTTLHDYRQNLRLRCSLESVVDSTRPLVDIALEAGFSSHSHFTNSFRREFLQTPSALRADRALPKRAIF